MNIKNRCLSPENRGKTFVFLLFLGAFLLVVCSLFSMTQGAAQIPIKEIWKAFSAFDETDSKHLLIIDMRLPRVLVAALVGASLAVAGALMQGLTRNPLADSGLMGLNSGAIFMIALASGYWTMLNYTQTMLLAFLGAAFGAISVYGISRVVPGGNQSMKLILAGATMTSLLSALSQGISIMTDSTQSMNFWTMGSVSGSSWKHLVVAIPVIVLSLILSVAISRYITIISLGDEVAKGLGIQMAWVRILGVVIVVTLAGTSVALAGMISFLGMMIPHFCRSLIGPDYRRIIPLSIVFGALLLVISDIFSKILNPPAEIPVGALIAVIGVPVFLYIARKKKEV